MFKDSANCKVGEKNEKKKRFEKRGTLYSIVKTKEHSFKPRRSIASAEVDVDIGIDFRQEKFIGAFRPL